MTKFLVTALAIAIFISFLKLGSVTLFDYDEAVFAEATKEMVQSGNWITPTYNGEKRYDKPILFYWLMSGSYKLFGINEFGARFPSAAAACLLSLPVFFFTRRFRGDRSGFYAVMALALSLYFVVYSHAAVTDMALTLFIALSLFSFFMEISNTEKQKPSAYIYGFYLFSALAFLTKGLIGIVFPFGIAAIYLLLTEGLAGIRKVLNLKGALLFLIFAAPWYTAQLMINGQEFIQQFFIRHHFTRYTDVISGHKGPFYYFMPALLIGLFPWIAFLPAGIKNALRDMKLRKANTLHSSPDLFALIWFLLIVAFFSFSTTKLPNYILSAIPAAVMLISSGMSGEDKKWGKYSFIFLTVLSAPAGLAYLFSGKYLLGFGIADVNWTLALAAAMFATAALSLYSAITGKKTYKYLVLLAMGSLIVLSAKAFPIANQQLQATLHKYSLYAKHRLPENQKILSYRVNNPSIVFYSDRRVINIRNTEELTAFMSAGAKDAPLAIARTADAGLLEAAGFTIHEKDKDYAILEKR